MCNLPHAQVEAPECEVQSSYLDPRLGPVSVAAVQSSPVRVVQLDTTRIFELHTGLHRCNSEPESQ
jgi:hypothetical protein